MSTRQFTHSIRLATSTGSVVPATLHCEARYGDGAAFERTCVIKLLCERCEVDGEGPDFFEAFCRVREAIESHGLTPLCYGASRNVFPSGMARDMGDGLSAWKLSLRQPTTEPVDIFAEGADVEPVSVATQREFWEAWLRSLDHWPEA